jgi:hypothetical protein
MNDIPEVDWKVLRELKPRALDRMCARILNTIQARCAVGERAPHDCYLAVFSDIHDGDEAIALIFNDLRRSNAIRRIALMRLEGLLESREYARFSATTRAAIERLGGLMIPSKFAPRPR